MGVTTTLAWYAASLQNRHRQLRQAVDAAFAKRASFTAAFVVEYKRRIVAERYGSGANQNMQLESRSMGRASSARSVAFSFSRAY